MDRILIVDDDVDARAHLADTVTAAGFVAVEAHDAGTAQRRIAANHPALILTEWLLPDAEGTEVLRLLKSQDPANEVPTIVVAGNGSEDDIVDSLQTGADDYIRKPYSPRELVARIHVQLRRRMGLADNHNGEVRHDGLVVDTRSHRVTADGESLNLRPAEYRLLEFLMTHPEQVWSRRQILRKVWNSDADVSERSVDVQVRRLRKALGTTPYERYVQTVRRVGYRFSSRCD